MAKRELKYYNNRYMGSLTETQCEIIEDLLELDKVNGCLTDLRHVIYNIDKSDVLQLIEDHEVFGRSIHNFERKIGTLRDDQTIGVGLMYYANNCILGDSVGLGKTVEIAGLCNLLKSEASKKGEDFKCLFLTEKNLVEQVREEMIKFTGEYVDLLPNGEIKTVRNYIEVCNEYGVRYSVAGSHSLISQPAFVGWLTQLDRDNNFPFDIIVVDESSVLGGSKSAITKTFKLISKYFKRIIFLNATPFDTKLGVFYNQLSLIDNKLLPTKTNFTKEYEIMDYRGMYPRPSGKYKNQQQFKDAVGYRYFARTRKDKGADMKDCSGGIKISPLSDIQKEWLRKSQMSRLVYDCPTYLDPSIDFNEINVPKLSSLADLLENEYSEADTILIFSHYKETQKYLSDWLSARGYSNRVLNGDTKKNDRIAIIESFKRSEFNVLITNVQKGLNFGNCNHCIFYSYDPNPSKMIQFEGRMTRDFDIIGKNIYILVSEGAEYKTLIRTVRDRAKATTEFTKTDISVVLNILLGVDLDVPKFSEEE